MGEADGATATGLGAGEGLFLSLGPRLKLNLKRELIRSMCGEEDGARGGEERRKRRGVGVEKRPKG